MTKTQKEFREELTKLMPGCKWTVKNRPKADGMAPYDEYMVAEGTRTAGFNRLSTVEVKRRCKAGVVTYEIRSAGFGKRAPWVHSHSASTLKKALGGMYTYYKGQASFYNGHAKTLEACMGAVGNE